MERDERELKELYLQARQNEREAPDFDELIARSGHRRRQVWTPILSLAAMVLLLLGAGIFLAEFTGEEVDDVGAPYLQVEATSMKETEMVAQELSDEWEELLEFADSLWEWESPSDFLL